MPHRRSSWTHDNEMQSPCRTLIVRDCWHEDRSRSTLVTTRGRPASAVMDLSSRRVRRVTDSARILGWSLARLSGVMSIGLIRIFRTLLVRSARSRICCARSTVRKWVPAYGRVEDGALAAKGCTTISALAEGECNGIRVYERGRVADTPRRQSSVPVRSSSLCAPHLRTWALALRLRPSLWSCCTAEGESRSRIRSGRTAHLRASSSSAVTTAARRLARI